MCRPIIGVLVASPICTRLVRGFLIIVLVPTPWIFVVVPTISASGSGKQHCVLLSRYIQRDVHWIHSGCKPVTFWEKPDNKTNMFRKRMKSVFHRFRLPRDKKGCRGRGGGPPGNGVPHEMFPQKHHAALLCKWPLQEALLILMLSGPGEERARLGNSLTPDVDMQKGCMSGCFGWGLCRQRRFAVALS